MSTGFDRTAINYATVTQAASDVRKTATDLTQELEVLMQEVKRVAETWEGEAKTAYGDIQRKNTTEMQAMAQQLNVIASLLDRSVVGYQGTDLDGAKRIRMLMG
ncbi:WXG100 family type VII secretion target [Streptomyces sp. MNU76]|uniref:WXG100 family type VII secretion target n=1 Tax=Streptomyces sp. MNU76 TaxID=2560026 RepID=UPI001E45B1A2|nr:WXG100 family type VII secretion target [Streptomyces sp. MNU76]MCC9708299.1 WXG100 family type VII secretion target [Streptomyces sp. MNU76]